MAFATKYSIEGTSDIYGKLTVNLRQDFYAGSITYFDGAGRDWISLSIGQGGNDISQAILPSSCSVQFYVNSDFAVLELAQDPPFSYQMQVLDSSNDVIWQGILLPEEYQEDYTNTPYIVTLVGSDGLEELKTIDYPITIGGKASLWDHLTTALSLTGLSLPYFESVNIYDVEMDTASSDSPFLQAEVTYESFLKINETPNCYDVIVAILKPFYSRIYQYRGWRIENIYGKKANYIERSYNSSGAYVSQETINPVVELDNDPTDFKAFLGKSGKLDFHPALNSTTVYFNTAQVVNPDGPGGWSLNSDWVDDNTLTDWTTENGITISKLPFGYNGSETILRIQGKQDTLATDKHLKSGVYTIDSADFQNFTFRFDYWMNYPTLVIFGTKPILYLQVELTDSLSNKWYFKNGNWTLIKADGWIRIDAPGRQIWRSFENNINTLPNITGSGDIRFYVYQLVKSGSADQVEVRLTNWATNLQIEEIYSDLILEEKAGQNILSTYKGPSFQHFISDGEVVDLAGVMDVNGVPTTEWSRRGETDDLNIRRLFMMQWLTMHQGQASKLSGTLFQKGEKVTPMSVIKDKDSVSTRKYVMTVWSFNLGNGIGSIKYHEIFENEVTPFYLVDFVTSIPSSAYILPDYTIPVGVPGLSPGITPGGGGINIPTISFPALNGDVRGEPSGAELTPSAIFGKARLDTTGLIADDIIFNAVKDTPDQENMTNLRLVDTYPILDTNFVPYTGAKANTNLGEYGLTTGNLVFDTTPTNIPTAQGSMYWDVDDETVALVMNGAIQKVGEDSFYQVKNQTGSNIAKGVAVRFAGTVGNSGRLLIAPFLADGTYPSTYFMGVTMEAIANGEDGKVMWFGRIRGINTNAYNEGDILYASTTVAGGFQTAVPQAPNNIVEVCAVVTKSTTVGTIFVRPTLGSNINRDEGVKITSPATGQLLQLQSNGLWENKTKAQILGGTSSQFVKGDGSLDSTSYQSTAQKGQPSGYASLDSNGKVPLTQINDALLGNVNYQGLWNASTNTPTLANPPSAGTKGYYYIVSTAGTQFGISFEIGDWIISNGSSWSKVDNTDAVSSVFGRTGNVIAAEADYQSYYPRLSQTYNNPSWINQLAWSKITGTPTTLGGYGITDAVPSSRKLTINGTSFDLSDNRSWTIPTHDAVTLGTANGLSLSGQILSLGLASSTTNGALSSTDWNTFNNKQTQLNGTGFVKANGTTISYDNSTYYLASNPAGYTTNTGTVTSVGLSSSTSGVTIGSTPVTTSGTITLSIATASSSQQGLLSSTDWNTFNNKQNALTNPVTGTGNTNYLAKFTSNGSTIGNSVVFESIGNVGIGTNNPTFYGASYRTLQLDATSFPVFNMSSNGVNQFLIVGSTLETLLGTFTNTPLIFYSNSTERMRIFSGGNVHIGSTPSSDNGAKLQVSGTSTFSGDATYDATSSNANIVLKRSASYDASIYFLNSSTFQWNINTDLSNNLNFFKFQGGAGNALTIAYTGAATFSSSVTASFFSSVSAQFNPYTSAGTVASPVFQDAILLGTSSNAAKIQFGNEFQSTHGSYIRFQVNSASSINAPTTSLTLFPSGAATFSSSVTATSFFESSDSRIKTLLEDNLDYKEIANVSAKYYEKNGKIELGYFAQDFEKLLPSSVSKNEDGYLNLSYRQVHTAKIAWLEKRIEELEKQLKDIK